MPKAWKPEPEVLEWIRAKFTYESDTGILRHAHDDPGLFFKKGDPAGFQKRCGYLAVSLHNTAIGLRHRQVTVHRIAWFLHHSEWTTENIDHVNLDKLDNRIENLRLATLQQNSVNSAKRRTWCGKPCLNRLKGAYLCKKNGRWYSTIKLNGRTIWLGWHSTEEEAAAAYATAALKHHGEYARPSV